MVMMVMRMRRRRRRYERGRPRAQFAVNPDFFWSASGPMYGTCIHTYIHALRFPERLIGRHLAITGSEILAASCRSIITYLHSIPTLCTPLGIQSMGSLLYFTLPMDGGASKGRKREPKKKVAIARNCFRRKRKRKAVFSFFLGNHQFIDWLFLLCMSVLHTYNTTTLTRTVGRYVCNVENGLTVRHRRVCCRDSTQTGPPIIYLRPTYSCTTLNKMLTLHLAKNTSSTTKSAVAWLCQQSNL